MRPLWRVGLLSSVVALLVSCGDNGSSVSVSPAGFFAARAIHASPDAPTVDVFVNGSEAADGLTFFSLTPSLSVPAGITEIEVFGTSPGSALPSGSPVIEGTLSFAAATSQTLVVGGLVNPLSNQQPLQLLAFTDDVIPTPGAAEVRIIHLSPDAPAVDVRVGNQDPQGDLLATLAFGQATPTNLVLPPGTYTVSVFASGTATFAGSRTVTVAADQVYTVYAVGLLSDSSFRLEVSQDT